MTCGIGRSSRETDDEENDDDDSVRSSGREWEEGDGYE